MSVFRFSLCVPKIACTPSPTTTTPAAPSALSFVRVGFAYVIELHAQPRDARIEAGDVAASAEGAHQLQREIVAADATGGFHSFVLLLTSRSEQVEAADREGEDTVIHCRPDRADDQKPQRVVRLRKEHDVVDEPVRERESVPDVQARRRRSRRRRRAPRGRHTEPERRRGKRTRSAP